MSWRSYIPQPVKTRLQLIKRSIRDRQSGVANQLVKPSNSLADYEGFAHRITIEQPIFVTSRSVNKAENIRLAKNHLENCIIQPGMVFSFWKLVGNPSPARGYKVGRNLIGGELKEDYGGGLCQLASITYHLCLTAGLPILERFNHSLDLYREDERFTPLGADAAVVFGYKDLRFRNDFDHALRFTYEVHDDRLKASLCSTQPIPEQDIEFSRETLENNRVKVTTTVQGKTLNQATYRKKIPQ